MSSLPNNFHPSDYEFLIKSLTEGNYLAKAESLKRFNTLITTDKKQFSIYAKRVVLGMQDLLFEAKVYYSFKPGRYQFISQYIDFRNNQSQSQRNLILCKKQTIKTNREKLRRLKATNKKNLTLLSAGLCQNVQII